MVRSSATYKLENVQWRRPGIQELEISTLIKHGDPIPPLPEPKDYLAGYAGQMVERRVERQEIADKITWKFRRGLRLPDFVSPPPPGGNDGTFWTMDVALGQQPITSHPNLQAIMAAGGGVLKQGEVEWPRYLNEVKNPWYGTNSFLFPSVTVSKEEIRLGVSNTNGLSFTEVDEVGYSTSSLDTGAFPGASGGGGKGRKPWILESHTLSKVGNELRERKTWRHGGVLGWADQIYDKNWRAQKE